MTAQNEVFESILSFIVKIYIPFGRFSLFLIFFWFGILKTIGFSPADDLVQSLQQRTLSFLTFSQFIIIFSLFEIFIGILFLFPRFTRFVYVLFMLHMGMTLMPLFLLPQMSWQSFLVPTIEGQYMIKNLVLISLASCIMVDNERKHARRRK